MQTDNINVFIPFGSKSNWEQQAKNIVTFDNKILENHLSDLLTWLQDMNWPGSCIVSKYLQTLGEPLVPYIKEILKTCDTQWIYFIFEEIVTNWSTELIKQLENELVQLTKVTDFDGNFIKALTLLNKHNILSKIIIDEIKSNLAFRLTTEKNIYNNLLNDLSKIE